MINDSERTSADPRHGQSPGAPTLLATNLGPRHARPALPRLSTARAAVLRSVVAAGGAVTVAILAEQLGGHPNTVREHLDALVADERIERVRSTPAGRGRPAWLYQPRADTEPNPNGAARSSEMLSGPLGTDGQEYIALAVALIDQVSATSPNPQVLARQAGERWGRALAEQRLASRDYDSEYDDESAPDAGPVDRVVDMLRDLRFDPHRTGAEKTVRLTTCPFLDAARRHPDVVCQVHLGIVRGAMERFGADPDSTDLQAFAEPGACLLNLPDVQ